MRPIPTAHKKQIDQDPFYKKCARRNDGECGGRITIEHCLIFAGKQIAEMWNYIPLCERHHSVLSYQDRGDLQKEKNVWIALNRATEQDLLKYSKSINYLDLKNRLNKKYGTYKL